MPSKLTDIDFIQESLNFSEISPVHFENLVFHLIDEMGYSNIIWRKGGEGNSATDGGRDLEATNWIVEPAKSRELKYWFEVKYRSKQLEKIQVQQTVINSTGNKDVDQVVIVTNKTVSNPTLDWVKKYQLDNSQCPTIVIWQGHDLELLLRRNQSTLLKFLSSSLSFEGRCKVIESRFLNLLQLPSGNDLFELWKMKEHFGNNITLNLVSCLAEVTYGNVIKHPWGMILDEELLLAVVSIGMCNVYPFAHKYSSLDRDQEPLMTGMSYLFQCLLIRYDPEVASKIMFNVEHFYETGTELPEKLLYNRYKPIIETIYDELAIRCSSDCSKLHYRAEEENLDYFKRFSIDENLTDEDESFLVINSKNTECSLNIVSNNHFCPLGNKDLDTSSYELLYEALAFANEVIISQRNRISEIS